MGNDKKTLELQLKISAENAQKVIKEISQDLSTLSKKTINTDNSGLANTFKRMETEAVKASKSLKLFGVSSEDLKNIQNQLKKTTLDLVDNGFEPNSKEVQNLVNNYKDIQNQTKQIDKANGDIFKCFIRI